MLVTGSHTSLHDAHDEINVIVSYIEDIGLFVFTIRLYPTLP